MSQIYVIRHGQASFGTDHYDRLSPIGKRQAEILGDHFVRIDAKFQAVYAGSLQRQIDTAKIVLSRFPDALSFPEIVISKDFDEFNSTPFIKAQLADLTDQNPSIADALKRINSDRQAFKLIFGKAMLRLAEPKYHVPGLETFQAFAKRVKEGVRKICNQNSVDSNIAVFTSSGTISRR